MHMTVLVKLPIEIYHGFMDRCPFGQPGICHFKNSLIIQQVNKSQILRRRSYP